MTREKEIFKVTLVGSAVNVLLTAFKFVAGIVGHSAAMTADAVHSLSDLLTDAVVLLFVRISGKPEDRSHDYGHGKYETLATAVIGIALVVVAVGIGYRALVAMLFWYRGGTLPAPGMLALWAALVSVALKELVYRYTLRHARKLGSPAMEANAWHHRSDALSSLGTLLGIGGAIYWAGIDRIYYANTRDDAAAADFADGFIYEELDKPLAERSLPIVPLLRDEALHTFRRWQEKADKTVY